MTETLTGHQAIAVARRAKVRLHKYADPTEGWRGDLTPDEAEEVAAQDPSLIYLPLSSDARVWDAYRAEQGYAGGY